MIAYVIKTKYGYANMLVDNNKLNEAHLYPTKKEAEDDFFGEFDEEIIKVDIRRVK